MNKEMNKEPEEEIPITIRTKKQLRLEKLLEKELEMLIKLDPLDDQKLYKRISESYAENAAKYIKRYKDYKSPYLNPSRLSERNN